MKVDRERFQEACNVLRENININTYLEKEGHVGFSLGEGDKMIRCPFPDHDDNTPSFSYNLEKQVFNCFGCDRGGDIVNLHYFFSEIEDERYTRTKAVRELSNKYGITIPDLFRREMKTGRVNKYRRTKVNTNYLTDDFYKEKIRGYEKLIRNADEKKRIQIYKWIDDMYLGEKEVKEVFNLIRKEV